MREVERAVNKGIPILPFRIEDIAPTKQPVIERESGNDFNSVSDKSDHATDCIPTVSLIAIYPSAGPSIHRAEYEHYATCSDRYACYVTGVAHQN